MHRPYSTQILLLPILLRVTPRSTPLAGGVSSALVMNEFSDLNGARVASYIFFILVILYGLSLFLYWPTR
ncbi:hypothetical protein OAO87_02550 [bacterium]|nr:hypothetical protein [bacterium]